MDFKQNDYGSAAALLQSSDGTGQCSTWASLLQDAFTLNGVNVAYIKAQPKAIQVSEDLSNTPDRFLVKDWTFLQSHSEIPNVWLFNFPSDAPDMVPIPDDGVYGDLKNKNTLLGQNSSPPSEKVFNNHQFLCITSSDSKTIYYDPSYGVTYASESDFQAKAVDGFGFDNDTPGGKWQDLVIKPIPDVTSIQFITIP